jgi:LacI family transcriptional regulator
MTQQPKTRPVVTLPDSDHRPPTLKILAQETGLAVATVSRALKDAPDIGMATKTRVREAAERLGYRPNRAGVRLRTGKTNVIALVLSTEADVMAHTSRLIYSISNALRGTAYHLIVMPFFPDQDPMDPVRYIVETESADAIILNQTKPDDPRIRYMMERGFPFAAHGRTAMNVDHAYFDFDSEAYTRLAVETLVAAGRKRLYLIPPPVIHSYAIHSIDGFVKACNRLGVPYEIETQFSSDDSSALMEEAMLDRMAKQGRCDGIVSCSTTAAMAAIVGAERTGLVLGADFDVVAKEAIPFLRRFREAIFLVKEDVGAAGDFVARAVVAIIEKRSEVPLQGLETPVAVEMPPPKRR